MPRECGNALAWMGCLVGNIGRGGVPDKQPTCAASDADAYRCRWSPTFDPEVKTEIVPAHHQKPITRPITKRIKLRTRRGAMPLDRGEGYRSPVPPVVEPETVADVSDAVRHADGVRWG